jgi:hypothetical protein
MVNPGALQPVHQGTAECRPLLAQGRDRLSHLDDRPEILLDQHGEPLGVLVSDLHRPSQANPPEFKAQLNFRWRCYLTQPRARQGHPATRAPRQQGRWPHSARRSSFPAASGGVAIRARTDYAPVAECRDHRRRPDPPDWRGQDRREGGTLGPIRTATRCAFLRALLVTQRDHAGDRRGPGRRLLAPRGVAGLLEVTVGWPRLMSMLRAPRAFRWLDRP